MVSLAEAAGAIDADALRLRHEFLDMPGLVLTVAQAARLYALSAAHAQALLDALVDDGFLDGGSGVGYRRSAPPTGD